MAKITAGFASSFSPQLHVPAEMWPQMGERDKNARALLAPDGKNHTYDELLAMAGPAVAAAITPQEQAARYKQCTEDIATVAKKIQAASIDALIMLTDDEHILFGDDNFPTALFYYGETVPYVPRNTGDNVPPLTKAGLWAYGQEPLQLPGSPKLGEHILKHLPKAGFDVSRSSGLKEGVGIGHHVGFANTRLLGGKALPLLPILFNTSFPPNIMTTRRFYGFGEALKAAVESWPEDARVGVLVVGGFSHPVIDEAMDRKIIEGCRTKDAESLRSIPEEPLYGPNGQGRSWIAAAGALQHLNMQFHDYVPAYRSPAGTGCGMGFACWE